MKNSFYPRMAASNLRKNRRLYLPYILAGAGFTAILYILMTLSMDNRLREVRGGDFLPDIMRIGVYVMLLLSVIMILYTNSFLMKQRKREFGLYNILGLEKRHVGRILFFETLFSALCAIAAGLLAGIVLYKLCALLICRILLVDSVLGFYHVSPATLIPTALFFTALYLFTYVLNRIQIAGLKPVDLLQSVSAGEREPKVKWPFLVIGILTLGAGYYIALSVESPLLALLLFFVAIVLVIIGTYCLFISGTIALLRLLKKNERFYYHKKHMIAVSDLLYRMKQNAVGLASITVLASGVLVMVSTTVCMYAGIQDTLDRNHPHHLSMSASYVAADGESKQISTDVLLDMAEQAAADNGLEIVFAQGQHYLEVSYFYQGDSFSTDHTDEELLWLAENSASDQIGVCTFMTAAEYEALTGISVELQSHEVACYEFPSNVRPIHDNFSLAGVPYRIAERLDQFPISMASLSLMTCFGMVVQDDAALQEIYETQLADYGSSMASLMNCSLEIDFSDEDAAYGNRTPFAEQLRDMLREYATTQPDSTGGYGSSYNSRPDSVRSYYGLNGTLLFLGLLLTIVFLFATALIIYYKQISEGYDDRHRFQIMQKVGMSSGEIKGTIHSQIMLVFFLPLAVAAVHITVAFPILTKLLNILFTTDNTLFLYCTIGAFAAFAVIYILIYSLTARVYYQIVR